MDKTSKIYKDVKKDADKKFKEKTSIYKSAWIVREYKKRNGKFNDKKTKNTGLKRWFNEEWIRIDYKTGKVMMKNGKKVQCGRSNKEMDKNVKKGLCRPYKKVNNKTPKTVKELGSKELKRRAKLKKKTPNKIIK